MSLQVLLITFHSFPFLHIMPQTELNHKLVMLYPRTSYFMPFLWDIDTIVVEIEPWPRLCHWCRATVMDLFSNRHTKPERAWRSNLMIQLVSQSEAMWWEIEGSTLQMPRPQKRLHLLLFEILSGRAWVCTLFCELAPTRQVVTAICLHLCFYRAFYHRAPKALYTLTPWFSVVTGGEFKLK